MSYRTSPSFSIGGVRFTRSHGFTLPPNRRPPGFDAESLHWRRLVAFSRETPGADFVRDHSQMIGQRDERKVLEAEADNLAAGLIGHLDHDDAVAGDLARANVDVASRPDFERLHGHPSTSSYTGVVAEGGMGVTRRASGAHGGSEGA